MKIPHILHLLHPPIKEKDSSEWGICKKRILLVVVSQQSACDVFNPFTSIFYRPNILSAASQTSTTINVCSYIKTFL